MTTPFHFRDFDGLRDRRKSLSVNRHPELPAVRRLLATICVLAGIILMPGVAPAQQDAAAFRTWTDSTGRFRVEASLVAVQEGQVHLKKRTGTVVHVPLRRLSQADREYVRSLAKPAKPPTIEQVRSTVVVLQRSTDGQTWYGMPGVLILRDRHFGYVVSAPSHRVSTTRSPSRGESRYRVVLFPGSDAETAIVAESVGVDASVGLAAWRVPVGKLPAPLPLAGSPELSGTRFCSET